MGIWPEMNVNHKFTRRRAPIALVITVVIGMSGLGLVAYFASDLVEFFVSSSASATPDFFPMPIGPAP